MNVFGSSQSGETNKIISNLEQSINSFSSKLDKIQYLLEENHKSIAEYMTRGEVSLKSIKESTEATKIIIPAILSRLNTIETYYKDKP